MYGRDRQVGKQLNYCGEIRDPIHGLIPVTKIEFRIMDTPTFQRLRRIKQLALADLGFHGAVHNRFGHSVGVMHIASRIASHLDDTSEVAIEGSEHQNIRLAALLHDIGHGPFSHISEYLLKHFDKRSSSQNETEEIHEEISHYIIAQEEGIKSILGNQGIKSILSILSTEQPSPDFQHDIVSGPLDADKMDYLLRDSYFAGVKYGVFDLDRLINVLTLSVDHKRLRLAVKREGLQAVEQYVLAKYFIAHQVYQHRIRHITDKMIIEGVKAAIEDGNNELKRLFAYKANKSYMTEYLKWDDERVFQSVLEKNKSGSKGHIYFSMLRRRQLLTEISNTRVADIESGDSTEAYLVIERIRQGDCQDLIRELETEFDLKAGFTHVLIYSLKVPLIQRSFGIVDEQSIRIRMNEKVTGLLDHESSLYKGIEDDAKDHYVQVIGLPKGKLKSPVTREKNSKRVLTRYIMGG